MRVRMIVDVELLVDRNASVAEASCMQDTPLGVIHIASATGSAKRQPGDVFDVDVAQGLAVGRALEALGEVIVSQAEKAVASRERSERAAHEEWSRKKAEQLSSNLKAKKEARERNRQAQALVAGRAAARSGTEVSEDEFRAMLWEWYDYQHGSWKPGTEDFLKAWKVVR